MNHNDDQKWASNYKSTGDNKGPQNVTSKDDIICKELIQVGPGLTRKVCNKSMDITRLFNQVPVNDVVCASKCGEYIKPQSRYVAICRNNGQHITAQPNIICVECVDKYALMHYSDKMNKFKVKKDVYK